MSAAEPAPDAQRTIGGARGGQSYQNSRKRGGARGGRGRGAQARAYITPCQRGSLPNVYWRSIAMDELRSHPRFVSLPPVPSLTLAGPATFRWVRQDDALWEDLHESVLTSRHLLAVLGFREPRAARILGLNRAFVSPNALVDSYYAFRQANPLGHTSAPGAALRRPGRAIEAEAARTNHALRAALHSFYAAEARWPPLEEDSVRGLGSVRMPRSIGELRCRWGSAQEAAALASLLEALPEEARVEEVGLAMLLPEQLPPTFPAEVRRAAAAGELPPIGASPDGVLRREAGRKIEAIEIKNHCPFFVRERRVAGAGDGGSSAGASGTGGDGVPDDGAESYHVWAGQLLDWELEQLPWFETRGPLDSIPPQYVPQVQLESLCVGADVNNFVSASACQGLRVFRSHRDDAYLGEMLHFISKFWSRVKQGKRPSPELHWQEADRYERFLKATVRIGRGATLDEHVRQPWRRSAEGVLGSFFLDEWVVPQ